MRALLHDPSAVHHQDAVHARKRGEAVRDCDHRATLAESVDGILNQRLGL